MHLEVKDRVKESLGRLPHSLDSATREFACRSLFVSLLHVFFSFHCSTLKTLTRVQILPVLSFDYTQVASVLYCCHLIQKFHVTVSRLLRSICNEQTCERLYCITVVIVFSTAHTHTHTDTHTLSLFWIGKKK